MKILAISGSLRAGSSNTAVLRAAARLAPAGVEIALFDGIADLPFFNPDLDGDRLPSPVAAFRVLVGEADGILISSPEYARGVAGVLKNALDWLVASFEFPNKPVALINTSPRATHALAVLTLTLETMSAQLSAMPASHYPCSALRTTRRRSLPTTSSPNRCARQSRALRSGS